MFGQGGAPLAGPEKLLSHLTSLRFCCAANVATASEAREPDAYRDSSNRLLERRPAMPCVYHLFQQIRDGPFLSDQTILESSCEHVAPYQMVP